MATLRGGQVDGTEDGDLIYGEGAGYLLRGLGGDDTIHGAFGGGTIIGGQGHDAIYGQSGDLIDGGGGNDTIFSSYGDSTIAGGQGDDSIQGWSGDVIDGGAGNDAIRAGEGSTVQGGAGDDTIRLPGLFGTDGAVSIDGGEGTDTLLIDEFVYGFGNSFDGIERIELNGILWVTESVVVDQTGANLVEIGLDRSSSAVQLVIGIEGDRLTLSDFKLEGLPDDALNTIVLWGDETADSIVGSSYSDYLDGYGGDDLLKGGDGADGLEGRAGADTLAGGGGDDFLLGNVDADSLTGGDGNDTLNGGAGADTMKGGDGDDLYYVDDAADVVHDGAGRGTDRVSASVSCTLGAGLENLTLTGSADIDGTGNASANVIAGGEGRNVLDGGRGADTLTGGEGRDLFAFSSTLEETNVDHLTDFGEGDRLRLDSSVFSGFAAGGLGPGKFVLGTEAQDANDRVVYDAATGSLWFDRDGSGEAAAVLFAILDGAPELTSRDFVIV